MFRCQNQSCNKTVEANQPQNRIVTERREMVYEKKIRRRGRVVDMEEVRGWEIVKEISVCPKCFQKLTGQQPRMFIKPEQPKKTKEYNPRRPPRRKKWQNPKNKDGGNSHRSRSQENQTQATSSRQSRKKPIVEKVNPIPVVKN